MTNKYHLKLNIITSEKIIFECLKLIYSRDENCRFDYQEIFSAIKYNNISNIISSYEPNRLLKII